MEEKVLVGFVEPEVKQTSVDKKIKKLEEKLEELEILVRTRT